MRGAAFLYIQRARLCVSDKGIQFCCSFFLLRPEKGLYRASRRPLNSDYSPRTHTHALPPNNLHAQRNKTFNLLIMIQCCWRLRVGRPFLSAHLIWNPISCSPFLWREMHFSLSRAAQTESQQQQSLIWHFLRQVADAGINVLYIYMCDAHTRLTVVALISSLHNTHRQLQKHTVLGEHITWLRAPFDRYSPWLPARETTIACSGWWKKCNQDNVLK